MTHGSLSATQCNKDMVQEEDVVPGGAVFLM